MIDFVGRRYFYIILSLLITVPGLVSLVLFGLRAGIEFTSGSLVTVRFEQPAETAAVREALVAAGHPDAIVQRNGDGDFMFRTRVLAPEQRDSSGTLTASGERQRVVATLEERLGKTTVLSFDEVSPIVAQEIGQRAAIAVVVSSVFILLYISFAFRHLPKPFRYGACAIFALLHDVAVVLGAFSILGVVAHVEIDSMFVTAVLTVIGFSVHDTIVVFDRIRENGRRFPGRPLQTIVNESLMQTLARSLTTSLTLVFTLIALLLFGGVTIHNFVLTMLIGVVSGTYSSIFVASQLLVMWEQGELSLGRLFGGKPREETAGV